MFIARTGEEGQEALTCNKIFNILEQLLLTCHGGEVMVTVVMMLIMRQYDDINGDIDGDG